MDSSLFGEVFLSVVGTGFTIFTGVILARLARMEKKQDTRHKENIEREILLCTHRSDESVLLLEVVRAVRDGNSNGELLKAEERFEQTNREYETFVRSQAGIKLAENRK